MENWVILVLPVCLATSFLCAGMEAGIFALSRWRVAQLMRTGNRRAARLYSFLQNAENFLWTILVGNTLAAFIALWIIAVSLLRGVPGRPLLFWTAYLGALFLFYAFCDLLPKMLFRTYPNRLCLALSTPFRFLHLLLSPIVALIEGLTHLLLRWWGGQVFRGHMFSSRNELRRLMEETSQGLTTEERGMIRRVFDMNNIVVRQVTLPFSRYPELRENQLVRDALPRFREAPVNMIPVWDHHASKKRVAGFLNLKSLLFETDLKDTEPLSAHLSPVYYLDENTRLQDALRRLQRTGNRMAVVLSRDRREIGLVTLDEILKVIFGEEKQ